MESEDETVRQLMYHEKSVRSLRDNLTRRAKKEAKMAKMDNLKVVEKPPQYRNYDKEKLDSHICPRCEGEPYISKQALWRHIRRDHPDIDTSIDLKIKVCKYCGKTPKAMNQHLQRRHSHEEELPDVVKNVKVKFVTPGPETRPQWAPLVAQAISASGGMATVQEIAVWIYEMYPVFSSNNVTLKQIKQLANNTTNEYKNTWLKAVKQLWGPQQWYIVEDKYLEFLNKKKERRNKPRWGFKR